MKTSIFKKLSLLIIACLCMAMVFISPTIAFAEAEVCGTYGGVDSSTLWYYGNDFLNVEGAKQIISNWDKIVLNSLGTIYIAVVDTGINASHELFSDTIAKNSSGIVLGYNSYAATTGIGETSDITDTSNCHGTEVAGIIAMLIKEFGLENNIKIYPIKANTGTNDSFSIASIITALQWATKDDINVDVINMSLGTLASNNSEWATNKDLQNEINEAAKKAVIVSAAGNNSKESTTTNNTFYPAGLDGVISVMGYGTNGNIYSTSNYGKAYDIAAPGENIYAPATYIKGSGVSTYNSGIDGTSMASPFISFAAALLKLRLLYEGAEESKLNGNNLTRMILNTNSRTISKSSYSFKTLDYKTILEKDYNLSGYDYLNPTDLYMTYPTEDFDAVQNSYYMVANNIKEITFNAVVVPYGQTNPDLDSAVEWYLIDGYLQEQLIGTGLSITYAPKIGGQYKIIAKLKYDQTTYSDEIGWVIDFLPFYVAEARVTLVDNACDDVDVAPTGSYTYEKDPLTLSLTGIQYVDTSAGIKWYVNGEEVCSGNTFDFVVNQSGQYVISAKFGDNEINGDYSFTIEVRPRIEKPLYLSLLVVGCIIALAIVVLITIIIIKKEKRKNPLPKILMEEEFKVE